MKNIEYDKIIFNERDKQTLEGLNKFKLFLTEKQYNQIFKIVFKDKIKEYKKLKKNKLQK